MNRRIIAALLSMSLLFGLAIRADATDQPGFPVGAWEGQVLVSGWFSSDSVRDDGSFDTSVTNIIGDTVISLEIEVANDGSVSGTMDVRLIWFKEAVGTQPVNFDAYLVETYSEQNGQLSVSGTANRLVATGVLTSEKLVETEGAVLEGVSATEPVEVEWVFEVNLANCSIVQAPLVSASGQSIMRTVPLPRDSSGASELHNRLLAGILAIPPEIEPLDISDELEAIKTAANILVEPGIHHAPEFLDLIHAWRELAENLAALDVCQVAMLEQSDSFKESWLVFQLQVALADVQFDDELYDANDLMDIHDAAAEGGALAGKFVVGFLDMVNEHLDEAITFGEFSTILDIKVWAASWGYTMLHDAAADAYGDQTL